jgi:hypothetical protein
MMVMLSFKGYRGPELHMHDDDDLFAFSKPHPLGKYPGARQQQSRHQATVPHGHATIKLAGGRVRGNHQPRSRCQHLRSSGASARSPAKSHRKPSPQPPTRCSSVRCRQSATGSLRNPHTCSHSRSRRIFALRSRGRNHVPPAPSRRDIIWSIFPRSSRRAYYSPTAPMLSNLPVPSGPAECGPVGPSRFRMSR